MKRLSLLLLVAACILVSGCVKYRVTLDNGQSFTVLGKPKHDTVNGVYRYKAGGQEQVISAGRVIKIEPVSTQSTTEIQSSGY